MQRFEGLTIILLASNERESFRKTLRAITEACQPEDLTEIVVFLKSGDCPAAEEFAGIQQDEKQKVPLRPYIQKNKSLPEAFVEVPALINGSHLLIMFADFATDPASIPEMIRIEKKYPDAIVCAAKWLKASEVSGYGSLRKTGSRAVNRIAAGILRSNGRDLFSLYQIYPKQYLEELDTKDPYRFLCEYTLRPVSQGIPYIEIPTVYKKRTEKKTNTPITTMLKTVFLFISSAIQLRKVNQTENRRDQE